MNPERQHYGTIVVGAGVAGIATAYSLSRAGGTGPILVIDRLQPMSFTTAMSGENFRDYWPHSSMTAFSERSLDLMEALAEETGNRFDLRYFGYHFVSESAGRDLFAGRGAAEGEETLRPGLTIERDTAALRRRYPHLSRQIRQLVQIERAGAFDVHALGSLLLARARSSGTEFLQAGVATIERRAGGFAVGLEGREQEVTSDRVVLAAGPFVSELAAMLGVDLPVESFLQRKILIPDPDRIIPRDMAFTIFADPQVLAWPADEAELLAAEPEHRWLLEEFPPGLHVKPEGQDRVKLGWAFNRAAEPPRWKPPDDLTFPSIVLRGASRFIPGLERYADDIPTPVVQYAGYYTRTPENWPLIGPLAIDGLYAVAALSGYGTMCSCAAGELCARSMTGGRLPAYAAYFHPDRYADPAIAAEIEALGSDGQL